MDNIIKIYRNHKYNVSPVLKGGIGNNLFQIATVYSYAWDTKKQIIIEDIFIPGFGHQSTYAGTNKDLPTRICDIFPNINCVKGATYYWEYFECQGKDNDPNKIKHLIGRFISTHYFDHNRDKIIELLKFSPKLLDYIKNKYKFILDKETVSVHIRRGDFLKSIKNGKKHWCLLNTDYYENAFKIFQNKNCEYVFFAEDEESRNWIKNKLVPLISKSKYTIIQGESAPSDLCFMSLCKHNIIANSTFSIWGAYLNTYKDRIILAPSVWKKDDNIDSMSIKYRVPYNWTIIDCACRFDYL